MNDTRKFLESVAELLEEATLLVREYLEVGTSEARSTVIDPSEAPSRALRAYGRLGERQVKVIEVLAMAHPKALTEREIHEQIARRDLDDVSQQSTNQALTRLRELRLVRRHEDTSPYQFSLGPRIFED